MPRTPNPMKYPATFFEIADTVGDLMLPVEVPCETKGLALNLRTRWNSFTKALREEAERIAPISPANRTPEHGRTLAVLPLAQRVHCEVIVRPGYIGCRFEHTATRPEALAMEAAIARAKAGLPRVPAHDPQEVISSTTRVAGASDSEVVAPPPVTISESLSRVLSAVSPPRSGES